MVRKQSAVDVHEAGFTLHWCMFQSQFPFFISQMALIGSGTWTCTQGKKCMNLDIVRLKSGLPYMWKWIRYESDIYQCVYSVSGQTRHSLALLWACSWIQLALIVKSIKLFTFCCPTTVYFIFSGLQTGCFKCKQSLSWCKCRIQMWVTFKSECKQAVKKNGYSQHIRTGHLL